MESKKLKEKRKSMKGKGAEKIYRQGKVKNIPSNVGG